MAYCDRGRYNFRRRSTEVGNEIHRRHKKVVDMGDWYKIYFYFPHKSNIFLCQKDLIVQGTIEEFENIMYGKIVPKGLVSEQKLSE